MPGLLAYSWNSPHSLHWLDSWCVGALSIHWLISLPWFLRSGPKLCVERSLQFWYSFPSFKKKPLIHQWQSFSMVDVCDHTPQSLFCALILRLEPSPLYFLCFDGALDCFVYFHLSLLWCFWVFGFFSYIPNCIWPVDFSFSNFSQNSLFELWISIALLSSVVEERVITSLTLTDDTSSLGADSSSASHPQVYMQNKYIPFPS